MILKIASPSEYKELANLFFDVFNSVANKAQFNWPMENIQTELTMSTFLICCDEQSRICGFISFRDSEDALEIMALGTASWARRKNVMSLLLHEMQAKSRKASKPLLLEVHSQNQSAIQLYLKAGFQQIGLRKAYYMDRADALTFQYI